MPAPRPSRMDFNTLDLNLLRVFDALATERNVSLAGARLGLSQPAVSHALARLRKACGDPLFVRTSSGMQPTPFAIDLAEPVRAALAMRAAGLGQSNRFDPATSDRQFRLVLTDLGQAVFLPPLMREVSASAPGVRVIVQQLGHDALHGAMESGAVDLAIGGIAAPSEMPAIHVRQFWHPRFHHDAGVRWLRGVFASHFAGADS